MENKHSKQWLPISICLWLRSKAGSKPEPQSESLTPLPGSLPDSRPASQWRAAERLLALQETHALSGTALHAWCREKGLFAHQLSAWREAFCSAPALSSVQDARESKAQLKALQIQHEFLQRDLRRKEKALAEAAALLVLQKKFQALFGQEQC